MLIDLVEFISPFKGVRSVDIYGICMYIFGNRYIKYGSSVGKDWIGIFCATGKRASCLGLIHIWSLTDKKCPSLYLRLKVRETELRILCSGSARNSGSLGFSKEMLNIFKHKFSTWNIFYCFWKLNLMEETLSSLCDSWSSWSFVFYLEFLF